MCYVPCPVPAGVTLDPTWPGLAVFKYRYSTAGTAELRGIMFNVGSPEEPKRGGLGFGSLPEKGYTLDALDLVSLPRSRPYSPVPGASQPAGPSPSVVRACFGLGLGLPLDIHAFSLVRTLSAVWSPSRCVSQPFNGVKILRSARPRLPCVVGPALPRPAPERRDAQRIGPPGLDRQASHLRLPSRWAVLHGAGM
jgi:hypothetical protein